jgi:hypothetical protein
MIREKSPKLRHAAGTPASDVSFSSDAEEAASLIAAARESRRHRAAIAARPCRRGEPMMAYAAAVEPGGPRDRHQAIEFTVAIGVVRM